MRRPLAIRATPAPATSNDIKESGAITLAASTGAIAAVKITRAMTMVAIEGRGTGSGPAIPMAQRHGRRAVELLPGRVTHSRRARGFSLGLLAAAALTAVGAGRPRPNEIEIVASKAGFEPSVLKVRKGDSLRLLLKSADGEHCFALDAFRIEKRILPGRTTAVEVTLDRPGEYSFYCCLESAREAARGRLVVAE